MIVSSLNPLILGTTEPKPESTLPNIGSTNQAARDTHVHPRITSVTAGTLGLTGEATIMFTLNFDLMPFCSFSYAELADNNPLVFKVKSWVMNGNKYAGCVVKAYRGQPLPNNLTTLLALLSYNVFGGNATGITITCMAIPQSV